MLGEVFVVGYGVKGWWVVDREGGVGVLAVEAFLIAVDPEKGSVKSLLERLGSVHCLPVEVSFVFDASAVWKFREIDFCEEWFEVGVEVLEARRVW